MLKFSSKMIIPFITTFSLSLSAYADNIPEAYKFVSQDSLFTADIKPSINAWPVLSTNKSLKKIDLFKELSKDKSFISVLLDEKVRKNFGDNFIFSVSNFDFGAKDIEGIEMTIVEELKDNSMTSYIKEQLKKLYANRKDFKLETGSYKDAQLISYVSTGKTKEEKDDSVYLAFINNYVVAANTKATLQNNLKNFYNENPNLTTSADFSKGFNKVGSDFQGQFHLNMKKLISQLRTSKDFEKTMKDMNLDSLLYLNSVSLNFNLDPKGIEIRSYTGVDKNNKYAKISMDMKKSNFKPYVNYLPKNTLFFTGSSDVKDMGTIFKDYLPQMKKDIDIQTLIKENTGIEITEITDNIKDEFGMAIFNAESSPLIPGFAFFINPKDKEKMKTTFKGMKINLSGMDKGKRSQKKTNPEVMKFSTVKSYKDVEMSITNENDDLGKANIQPAYAFIGNSMVLASNEELLKSIIDRSQSTSSDFTLAGNPSFNKYMQMYGEESNGIGFINLATIINMLSPLLSGKEFKDTMTNIKKFDSIGFSSVADQDGGNFGRINIMADIENIDFEKLIPSPAKASFEKTAVKAKDSSVRANMHTLQTVAETYSVDNYGTYPDTLPALSKVAKASEYSYWKDFKNPYTNKIGVGKTGSLMDYKDYKNYKGKKIDLKGIVLFESLRCSYEKSLKKNSCQSYRIYGLDEKGEFIKDRGKVLFLSNE